MTRNFRRSLQRVLHEERGFALPAVLLLLTITFSVVSACLYVAVSVSEQVARTSASLQAQNIANAGVATELVLISKGKPANLCDQNYAGGDFTVTVQRQTTATTVTYIVTTAGYASTGAVANETDVVQSVAGSLTILHWRL